MIRTNTECFVFLDAKRPVSFPLKDKHVMNAHHVVHFNVPRDWFELNSRHQKRYSEGGKKIRGCRRHQKRIIPGWNAKKSLGQLIVLGPFNIQKYCFYSSLRRCMACAEDLRKIMRWKINKKRIMSLKFETTIRIRENQSNIENAKFVSIQRSKSIAMVNHFYKSTVCK